MLLPEAVYLGCFADRAHDRDDRVLPDFYTQRRGSMTIEYCFQFCWENDMRYAGMTKGNICMCGGADADYAKYGKARESQCFYGCDGYRYWEYPRICGGESTTSIYDLRSKYHFNFSQQSYYYTIRQPIEDHQM